MNFSTNFQSCVFKSLAIIGMLGFAIQPASAQQNKTKEVPIEILNQDGERVKSVEITGQAGGAVAGGGAGGRAVAGGAAGGGAFSVTNKDGKVVVTDSEGNEKELDINGARSVSVSQGSKIVIVNGERKRESFGKAIIIDSNGQRHEIDLGGPGAAGVNVPGFRGSFRAERVGSKFMVGVHCQPVSKLLASQLNLDADTGLVVVSINNGSPAADAGIQKHDILMFADDKQLSKRSDLTEAVDTAGKEKTKISLTLIRAGKEVGVDITPAERPEAPAGLNGMMLGRPEILGMFPELNGNFDLRMRQALPGIIIDPTNPAFAPPQLNQDLLKRMQEDMNEQMKDMMKQMDELRARQSEFLKGMEGLENGK